MSHVISSSYNHFIIMRTHRWPYGPCFLFFPLIFSARLEFFSSPALHFLPHQCYLAFNSPNPTINTPEFFSSKKKFTNLFHPELIGDCSRQLPSIPNFAEHRSYEVNMSAYWIELLASSVPSNDLGISKMVYTSNHIQSPDVWVVG